MTLTVAPHPLLDLCAFSVVLPDENGSSPDWLVAGLKPDFPAPMRSSDGVRAAVRDLLRVGGFKPTGRSKPASEYLLRAAAEGGLNPINPLVDACNVVSLHSGLPISVVDCERTIGALAVGIAPLGASYVFNASGQSIDVGGLLCLADGEGPCANAVKDAQRTKTHPGTRAALCLVWGTTALPGAAAKSAAWYRELLERVGGRTTVVQPE